MASLSNTRQKVRFKWKSGKFGSKFLIENWESRPTVPNKWRGPSGVHLCSSIGSWRPKIGFCTEPYTCDVIPKNHCGTHSADRNCNQSRPSPQFRTKRVFPQDLEILIIKLEGPGCHQCVAQRRIARWSRSWTAQAHKSGADMC